MTQTYETLSLKMDGPPQEDGTIEGYGSVFGNVDSYGDIVEKGAFSETLQRRKPSMLWQHSMDDPIGGWREYSEDSTGLWMRGKINMGFEGGKKAYALMREGDVDGLSIGFKTVDKRMDGNTRFLTKLDLFEVSVVTMPANDAARGRVVKGIWQPVAEKRDPAQWTVREWEKELQALGMAEDDAKEMIAKGIRPFCAEREAGKVPDTTDQRDADELKKLLMQLSYGASQ